MSKIYDFCKEVIDKNMSVVVDKVNSDKQINIYIELDNDEFEVALSTEKVDQTMRLINGSVNGTVHSFLQKLKCVDKLMEKYDLKIENLPIRFVHCDANVFEFFSDAESCDYTYITFPFDYDDVDCDKMIICRYPYHNMEVEKAIVKINGSLLHVRDRERDWLLNYPNDFAENIEVELDVSDVWFEFYIDDYFDEKDGYFKKWFRKEKYDHDYYSIYIATPQDVLLDFFKKFVR